MRVPQRELNLSIPCSLFRHLERQAEEQGVSLDTLCLSLLSGAQGEVLIDPAFYRSIALEILRKEIPKVISSALTPEEIKRRVKMIEFEVSKRYIIR